MQGNKVSTKPNITELVSPVEEEKDSVQMSQEATVLRTSDESVLDGEDRQTTMDQQPERVSLKS